MDKQVDLRLLYSVLGCMKLKMNAGRGCGKCPYLIALGGSYYFCDTEAIIEDVQDYLSALDGDMTGMNDIALNNKYFQEWRGLQDG